MTDAEIATWQSNRALSSTEFPYSTATCSSQESIDTVFDSKRIVIESENNYLKFDGEDKVNPDYNPSYTAKVMNHIVGAGYSHHKVNAMKLREN
jgi:hypothetical protein